MKKILTIIFLICSFGIGLGVGAVAVANILSAMAEDYRKSSEKFGRLFQLVSQWVQLKQDGKSVSSYFEKNNYNNIAIYGMGSVGESLLKELSNSNVNVKYAIDQKADKNIDSFVVSPDSVMEKVDAIVVTPIASYGEIRLRLREKTDCPIISIEDILYAI